MSVISKLHKTLAYQPFWRDLALAIDQELITFQKDRVLAQKNMMEWRTLDSSNFYDPTLFPSFDNYQSFLVDYLGFNPYSDLYSSPVKPAIMVDFTGSGAVTQYTNLGWKGPAGVGGVGGTGTVTHIYPSGSPQYGDTGFVTFDGTGSNYLKLGVLSGGSVIATTYPFSTNNGTITFKYIPTDVTNTMFSLISTGGGGHIVVNANRIRFVNNASGTVDVAFASQLVLGRVHHIGLRVRAGVWSVFLDGTLVGSATMADTWPGAGRTGAGITGTTYNGTAISTASLAFANIGSAPGNGTGVAFKGQIGTLRIFVEALSDTDMVGVAQGVDIGSTSWLLNLPECLRFMKAEAKGFGYRVVNRGNTGFYQWVFNKAKMVGRAYPLYRDSGTTNLLIKSIFMPIYADVVAMTNAPREPFTPGADAFNARARLDDASSTTSLDQGTPFKLDENFLGKSVVATKHIAIELLLGRCRDDFDNTVAPRYVDYTNLREVTLLQKQLDYLTREARFGKTTVEFPHVGVQLPLVCNRTDTTARYDLYTRTGMVVSASFPTSGWSATFLQTIKVYSTGIQAGALYQRGILPAEVDLVGTTNKFYQVNVMVPALAVGPVAMNGTNLTTSYGSTLTPHPVAPGTVKIAFTDTNSGNIVYLRDDGYGHLYYSHIVPDVNHWSGTINYTTGVFSFSTFISAGPTFVPGWTGSTSVTYNCATGTGNITIDYKTSLSAPIDKIELWSASAVMVTLTPPPLYFLKTENHLSVELQIAL